jgi:hypothetical protein
MWADLHRRWRSCCSGRRRVLEATGTAELINVYEIFGYRYHTALDKQSPPRSHYRRHRRVLHHCHGYPEFASQHPRTGLYDDQLVKVNGQWRSRVEP